MEKKSNSMIWFSLFFLASLLIEFYCLLVHRSDVIMIGGVGIVVLISGYLFIDSMLSRSTAATKHIENSMENCFNQLQTFQENKYNSLIESLEVKLSELDKGNKAIYVSEKKNTERLCSALDLQHQETRSALNEIKAELRSNTKVSIKYSQDNAKQILAHHKKIIEETVTHFDQETKALGQIVKDFCSQLDEMQTEQLKDRKDANNLFKVKLDVLEEILQDYGRSTDSVSREINQMGQSLKSIADSQNGRGMGVPYTMPSNLEAAEQITEFAQEAAITADQELPLMQAEEDLALSEMESDIDVWADMTENEAETPVIPDMQIEPEEIFAAEQEEISVKELDNPQPEGSMIEAEEEALPLAVSPSAFSGSSNGNMSADEIASMFASVGDAKEPELEAEPVKPESVVKPDTETIDPNKAMSADDIAALFASIGK